MTEPNEEQRQAWTHESGTAAGRPLTTAQMVARLERLPWWRTRIQPRLQPSGSPDSWVTTAASVVIASRYLRHRPLGELLPGLALRCDGVPSEYVESLRASNILRRHTTNTWTELAARSVEDMFAWQNAGWKVVSEIVRATIVAWASRDAQADVGLQQADTDDVNTEVSERKFGLGQLYKLVLRLCIEAYRAGAEDLREAVELAADSEPGTVLADSWRHVAALRLDYVLGLTDGLDRAWETLLEFDARERRILTARTFARGPQLTLGQLGDELNVTRERVRQLEQRCRDAITTRFRTEACVPVAHLAARLRRRLGSLAPAEAVEAVLYEAVPEGSKDVELRRSVLLELAGPYRRADGFWQLGFELTDLKGALAARADEPWTREELDQILDKAGVVSSHRDACLAALPLREFDDRMLVWSGSMADKAYRILRVHGEPMTRDELHQAVGRDVNVRSLVGRIQSDRRFRRLGRDSYGLAEWGGEEYTTIADELEQAIERRGGRAQLNELVNELVDLFGVSAQSVRSYASSRRFIRQADGSIVIAPDGHASVNVVRMPPELDRDLVRHRGVWAVRVRVDREVLRGSGRPLRTAIAHAAGLWPGETRTITLEGGSVHISWRGPQPALGSTRALATSLGCGDGDYLFVPLHDGERAFGVKKDALVMAKGLKRVALELGLPVSATLADVAVALGLPADASSADVRGRLRARRQSDLEALVPNGSGTTDDSLLDELIGLGE